MVLKVAWTFRCLLYFLCLSSALGGCKMKTTSGKCCVFPFIYIGVSYSACTWVNHDRLWCATTSDYDLHKKWGNCIVREAPFNLALGKPAVQSSPYRFKGYGEPSNAVDGNTNGDHMAKTCSHTKAPYEKNPWWRVDLGSSYLITRVVVYNRNDCCSGRLRNMEIRIGTSLSNNGNNNRAVATGESLHFRRMKSYTFAPVVGRYVNIALIGGNMILTLCEVQVFGIYTDIKYFIEGGKQSCDTICQKRGLECTSTYHGFMNINILDIFRDKGKNCTTGFDTDVYTYDDNPVYIDSTSGWGRRCVGWKDVPLKIKCWRVPPRDHIQRLCPCRKGKCERRWRTFGKSTYRFCSVQETRWIDAQAACQNLGADLVKIDTNAENEFVRTTVRDLSMLNIWIGLRRGWENRFYWTDGSRPQYSSLSSGQVEGSGEQKDCAKAFDGRWNKVLCDTTQHANSFVCEKQKCQNASETVQNLTFDNNSLVTSSSRDQNYSSFYGILKKSSGIWCPQSKSTIEWLTVDLGAPYFICGVAAVNDFKTRNETAVTWYKVTLSLEAIAGDTNEYSSSQEFRTDNSSDNTQVKELHGIARYLKFSPTRWNSWPCMKIAVYADGQVLPLRMTYGLRNKTVEHISSTTLRCFAHGYPFPTYTWTKDGSTVIPNGKLNEKNTVLRLSPLNFENEGWYTCTANTSLGSVNSSAYLTVHAKPIYIKVNSPVTAKTGQDAVLSCESKAFPVANVTWTKAGRVISNDSQYSLSSEHIQSSNILINNLTIHNVSVFDVGIYICTFSNYLGSVAGQIEVQIVDDCRPIAFDFENGESSLKGWGRTGIAFNNQPTYGDNLKIRDSSHSAGQQGKYWIGSFENRPSPSSPAGAATGNAPQGTLTSPEFQITGPRISFLIGGYCQSSFLQLLVGGKVVQSKSGDCQFGMKRNSWNIQNNYIGKKARLRLLDFSSSSWGHVSFDDFRGDIALCKGCMQPLGITNRVIPDFAMTASSMWDVNHSPIFGRLYTLRRDGHVGSWSSRVNRGGQWIQVDVGATTTVTKVATQGRSDLSQWVRSYYLRYSTDGSNFHRYNKLLIGNFDRNTIVENVLYSPVRGRYFRIYPQSWYRHMSLRMELYGCPIEPAVPTIQSYGIINETTAKEGDVVNLYCAAKGYPYVSYRWTRKDEKKELAVGQRLFFPVKPEDDGVYVCTAFNTAGTTQLRIRLHVSTAPNITQGMPKRHIAIKTKDLRLRCDAHAKPSPTVKWYKDGNLLLSDRRITTTRNEGAITKSVLHISDAKVTDGGEYKCVFENSQGRSSSTGTVIIHVAPEIIQKPKNKTVLQGDDVRLRCLANAVPSASYRWKLNGKLLPQGSNQVNGNLVISKIGFMQEGIYTCEAFNNVGSISFNAWISVCSKPSFRILPSPLMNVARAKPLVIHCEAVGKPEPEIDWSKDGVRLEPTKRLNFLSNKRILIIHKTERDDSGQYRCHARNIMGNATASITVRVFVKPSISRKLTRTKVTARSGVLATLGCFVSNSLSVQYTWLKDGKVLNDTETLKVHNNVLVVRPRKAQDYGEYKCQASNIAGKVTQIIVLASPTPYNRTLSPKVKVEAHSSARKGASLQLSILIPLVLIIVALVAVIVIQAYRYRRSSTTHASGDFLRMTSQHKSEQLLVDEQETSH